MRTACMILSMQLLGACIASPGISTSLPPTETLNPSAAEAVSIMHANCRYGPGTVYLYHMIFHEGDTAVVDGGNYARSWFWIQPAGADFHCWVSAVTVELNVPVEEIPRIYPPLPTNGSVETPRGVGAERAGSTVTIYWNPAAPSVDLAYLVEARVCQNGSLIEFVQTTTVTGMDMRDEEGCSRESSADVRVQNKLGYSSPVNVPWP